MTSYRPRYDSYADTRSKGQGGGLGDQLATADKARRSIETSRIQERGRVASRVPSPCKGEGQGGGLGERQGYFR